MRFVKLDWKFADGWTPFMVLATNGKIPRSELVKIPLWDSRIRIAAGERFCAGAFRGKYYYSCNNAPAKGEKICRECAKTDEFLPCIKCRGLCGNLKKRSGCESAVYNIYLASFGSRVKIGVSHQFRFFNRLIEQGADFACKLMTVTDGGYAREIEQEIAEKAGITDLVRSEFKMKNFLVNPNVSVNSIAGTITKLLDMDYDVNGTQIFDMRGFYGMYNIGSTPVPVDAEKMDITGSVVCVKGAIIVLENYGCLSAINCRELIGRDVMVSVERGCVLKKRND